MIARTPILPQRTRAIQGSFAAIEHRFLRSGFWETLNQHELLLYLFLVLVGDRQGLSWYGYDKIMSLLAFSLDEYIWARDGLINKDLIAFDGRMFQVLSLPETPVRQGPLVSREDMVRADPATFRQILEGNHAR